MSEVRPNDLQQATIDRLLNDPTVNDHSLVFHASHVTLFLDTTGGRFMHKVWDDGKLNTEA